jgi:transcriptional regulator
MYLPPQFAAKDSATTQATAHELIRANPLASLISVDDDGVPFVTPLPLHLLTGEGEGEQTLLLGHCAKPNPHWRYLAARPKAVVTFMGPHAYMTPRVYPDLARVPTWNYLMVHCTVEAKIIESFDDKDRLLKHLIADHDPVYADQWRGLGEEYQHKMMGGIVAFELKVLTMQCKVKLNQHRPEARAAMHALYSQGNDNERALAQWMDKLHQAVF